MDAALSALREAICWPIQHRALAEKLGASFPRGLLLHGPPGTGKTAAVRQVARECGAEVLEISAAALISSALGETEAALRAVFEKARELAAADLSRPVVLLADAVETLCPRRAQGGSAHEARVVAQLLTLLDGAKDQECWGRERSDAAQAEEETTPENISSPASLPRTPAPQRGRQSPAGGRNPGPSSPASNLPSTRLWTRGADESASRAKTQKKPRRPVISGHVVFVATTSHPGSIDPALRRGGRLDQEVAVGVPGPLARLSILRNLTRALPLAPCVDLTRLAQAAQGRSGADLGALVAEAAARALARLADEDVAAAGQLRASWGDFEAALASQPPSLTRGMVSESEPVGWEAVGGLRDVKRALRQAVEWPLQHPHALRRMGVRPARGLLLHGPPGTGKTTLARAAATAARAPLIALSAAALFSQYVGEGEALVRAVFDRARAAPPCVLFLDEIDALAGRRGAAEGAGGGEEVGRRLLLALLTEMDGLGRGAEGVLVIGATNRPDAVDEALLRPGRLDLCLYVPPPDADGRLEILSQKTRGMPLGPDVDLVDLADITERYTGAELGGVCVEAGLFALRRHGGGDELLVEQRDFVQALERVPPNLTQLDLDRALSWNRSKAAA